MNKIDTLFVSVGTKKYTLTIEHTREILDGSELVHIVCEGAGLDQDYPKEDLGLLIADIVTLIEQVQSKRQTDSIRLRVAPEDRAKIKENARKYGFSNMSEYIRMITANPEKFLQTR